MFVYTVLKMVDSAGVAERLNRSLPTTERKAPELVRGEELPEVRQAQKLHTHRRDLSGVGRRPTKHHCIDPLALPGLEGVPHLVREHANVVLAAHRVAEDHDFIRIVKGRAEPAHSLSRPVFELDRPLLTHAAKVTAKPRGELCKDSLRPVQLLPNWLRNALGERERWMVGCVPGPQGAGSEGGGLRTRQVSKQRADVRANRIPELAYLLRPVVDALHVGVAKRNEGLVPKVLPHG